MLSTKRKDAQMVTRMFDIKRDQRGITGLETAIIMIAFVVVASVFAYTVLSAGIFSSEKGKEAIHAGLSQAQSSMELVGPVVALDTNTDGNVDQIVFIVANTLGGQPINLTTTTDSNGDGLLSDESTQNNTTVISYTDQAQAINDIAWTKTAIGKNDGDNLLEAGEKFQITVDVSHLSPRLSADGTFVLEVKPDGGTSMTIQRTLPSVIDEVTTLD